MHMSFYSIEKYTTVSCRHSLM